MIKQKLLGVAFIFFGCVLFWLAEGLIAETEETYIICAFSKEQYQH